MPKLLKCDDFLVYDDETGTYSMSAEQAVRDETERNRWKNTGLTILKDWRLYLMLVPMILVYVFWKYLPMYELMRAFKNYDTAAQPADMDWYGLTYFNEIFFGGPAGSTRMLEFWRAFRNTFTIAFYNLLFGFPVPIIIALFFNEVRSNIARSIMQVCVYLPKFMSTVVVTTLVITLFRPETAGSEVGIVSKLLIAIAGKDSVLASEATQGLIYSARYYRALYVITELWEHAGYDSIVFFAAVIAVSPTSYEAAQMDGAGKMTQMRYVVLPSILSTVVIMLIMKIGSLLSVGYEKVYLLCPSSDMGNYEVANVVSTLNMLKAADFANGYGVAAEMANNLIGMILVIGANTIARKASDVSLY
jgi:putative aldouronate transport system permease protein